MQHIPLWHVVSSYRVTRNLLMLLKTTGNRDEGIAIHKTSTASRGGFKGGSHQWDHCDSLCRYSSAVQPQQQSSHHSSHLAKILSKAVSGLEKPLILCSVAEEIRETIRKTNTRVVGDLDNDRAVICFPATFCYCASLWSPSSISL